MAPKIDVLGAISHLYLFFRTIKQALIYVCAHYSSLNPFPLH